MNDGCTATVFALLFFLLGCVIGSHITEYIEESRWKSRIVDRPDVIAAIRSEVLAERELYILQRNVLEMDNP